MAGPAPCASSTTSRSVTTAEGKPKDPPPSRKEPETIAVTRSGMRHQDYFVKSIREGTPSRENARDGHYGAAAAHLINLAYNRGRRVHFDRATSAVQDA